LINVTTLASADELVMNFAPFRTLFSANFYEKALFVKVDLATDRSVANASALPFALCFYPL
jgi:hypothetical protein